MPGVEGLKSKRKPEAAPEEQKPVVPVWEKMISKMVYERIGGRPAGHIKETVRCLWGTTYRMNVWTKIPNPKMGVANPDRVENIEKILSWYLVFTPTGELIRSDPELPGTAPQIVVEDGK